MQKITPVSELVTKAEAVINRLCVAEAYQQQKNNQAILVDLRDIRELAKSGGIEGATHAPRGMLEFWVDPKSPYFKPVFATNKPLILFCASGWRSALAAKTLMEMGFDNIYDIKGGFTAWQEAGYFVSPHNTKNAHS